MQSLNGKLIFSATDLSNFLAWPPMGDCSFPNAGRPEQMRLVNGLCRYLELAGTAS
jgi:hypothetical protein